MQPTPIDDSTLEAAADHLVRLVNRDGTSGREAPAVDEMEAIAFEMKLPVQRMPVAPDRDNLLIGATKPRFVLCTHLDTVPPFIPATRDSEAIYGRGSADARGVAIAMLHAMAKVQNDSVACLFVVGEETDHSGAAAVAKTDLKPEVIILGEPCELARIPAQKGLLKVRISAQGVAAHSAYPEIGVSAIHRLVAGLSRLEAAPLPDDPVLGTTTLNVGLIQGGLAANVIAPEAEATILIRCAAPVDDIYQEVTARLGPELTTEILSRTDPVTFYLEPDSPDPVGNAVPFNTDARWLASLGARMILLGPGDMRCAHSPREHLKLEDLRAGIAAYRDLLGRLIAA